MCFKTDREQKSCLSSEIEPLEVEKPSKFTDFTTESLCKLQYSRTYFDIHLFRQVYKSAIFFLMFLALNSTFTYFDICWNKLVKILFFSMFYQYSDTNSYIFSDFFPSFSRTYFDIHLFRQISPKFLSSLISTCRNKESTVGYRPMDMT